MFGVLVKQWRAAVIPNKDIWDSIIIVVATDALHDEFNHVTSGLLGQGGEKSVAEIQSLLSSAEAKLLSKRAISMIADLAHMVKNSGHKRKTTVTSKNECFNCYKMGHYGRDCKYPDYRLLNKKKSSNNTRQDRDCGNSPRARQNNNTQPCRANVTANLKDKNFNLESFRLLKVLMTTKSSIILKTKSTWYLDLCASHHLTNDWNLFIGNIRPKAWDFTTANGQIIRSEGVGTVQIALVNDKSIKLVEVTLITDCKSNLILLGQLRDNRITYHNNRSSIFLMQDGQPIAHVRRDRNLFILDIATTGKVIQVNANIQAMMITGHRKPTHLISRIKKVYIWHWRFGNASNVRIIWAQNYWMESATLMKNMTLQKYTATPRHLI